MQPKKWCPYVPFSVTQSFLLRSSWSSDNITASNKESISKSLSVFRVHKIIVISLLCQYGLFIHTSRLKTWIFYLLWYNTIRWSTHTYKKDHFFYFIVCLCKWHTFWLAPFLTCCITVMLLHIERKWLFRRNLATISALMLLMEVLKNFN